MKWVEIISYDATKNQSSVVVRCIFENGVIRYEGDASVIAQLEHGIPLFGGTVMPGDGEKFLEAVRSGYRSAYLFASEIQSH